MRTTHQSSIVLPVPGEVSEPFNRRITGAIAVLLTVSFAFHVVAQEAFFDDFNDGSATDGMPARWSGLNSGDVFHVEDGDLVIGDSGIGAADVVTRRPYTDISIKTQGRILEGEYINLFSRFQSGGPNGWTSYGGFVAEDGSILGGMGGNIFFEGSSDLDPLNEDVVMQLDTIGDSVTFWAWRAGESRPAEPYFSIEDSRAVRGVSGVAVGYDGENSGVVRYIQVATESIPAIRSGDFDNDGDLLAADIDALAAAIRDPRPSLWFDLNEDGNVDLTDHNVWVAERRVTWMGDANLDGEFNSADLVDVLAAGEYEDGIALNSGWAEGDWDGDGDFTSGDLVVALQDGGYELGPRGAVAPVPEPRSAFFTTFGLLASLFRKNSKNLRNLRARNA